MAADLVRVDQQLPSGTLDIWRDAAELSKAIANTDFVPKALRNNPAAVTAAILTGSEVGLPPMASLSMIFVFEGKPGLYAEAMRALVLSHGHEIWPDDTEYTASKVTLYGRRSGSDNVVKVTWTIDMAKAANLTSKTTWRAYPRQLLLARATGELCRLLFPDVLRGVAYTVEELQDGLLGDEPAPAGDSGEPKTQTRKAAPTKKAAAKQAAPALPAPPTAPAPPPPLPGEDGFDDPTGAPANSDDVKKRAQQIAMRCQDAGLDDDGRHHLIEVVTNGRVSSAKEVTAEEGADVLQAAREIVEGRLQLVEGDSGWQLIAVEDATGDEAEVDGGEPDVTEADRWSGEQWRAYLRAKGVKVSETIREAQRLAGEAGEEPPVSLESLTGRRGLCGLVVGFVEDLAEQRGSGQ